MRLNIHLPKAILRQSVSSIAIFLCNFLYGCKFGWMAASTYIFESPNPPVNATTEDIAWIATVSYVTSIINVILCLVLGNNMSRKRFITIGIVIYLTMWLLLITANNVTTILFCMFFIGLTANFLSALTNIYLGEITSPDNREIMGVVHNIMFATGKEVQYAMSSFNDYFLLSLFPCVCSFLALLSSYWMLESPYYLVSTDADEQAKKNIAWLSNETTIENVEKEYEDVKKYVKEHSETNVSGILATFLKPDNLKLFLFYAVVYSGAYVNSNNAISTYGYELVKKLRVVVNGNFFMNFYSTLQIFCYLLSFITVRHFNRRKLLLIGSILCALTEGLCALCFYIAERNNYNAPYASYSVILLLNVFLVFFVLMVSSALAILRTETYSYQMKLFCQLLVNVVMDLALFIQLQLFFPVAETLGQSVNLLMYSVCGVVTVFSVYYFMRDTKNKSLLLIRNEYNSFGLSAANNMVPNFAQL